MMTKADFKLIAELLGEVPHKTIRRELLIQRFMDTFERNYPRFDRDLFFAQIQVKEHHYVP